MPLDRLYGETIADLPHSMHVVVEPRELAALTNVKTTYQIKNKKFGFRTASRPIFDDAVQHAIDAFKKAGAMWPVRFDEDDVLVQVYPKDKKVAVIFQRKIVDRDYYVTRLYDLPAPVLDALLATTGKKMPATH